MRKILKPRVKRSIMSSNIVSATKLDLVVVFDGPLGKVARCYMITVVGIFVAHKASLSPDFRWLVGVH